MLGENADATAQIMLNMADNTGATDHAFAEASKTMKFQFNQALTNMKVALTEVGNVVGPIVLPLLNELSERVKEAARWFKELNPETQSFLLIAAGIAAALGPALLAVGLLIKAIGVLMAVLGSAALPWILLAAAIAGAAYLIIKNWDDIKAAALRLGWSLNKIFTGIKTILSAIFEGIFNQTKLWLVDKIKDVEGWITVQWAKITNAYIKARNFIVGLFGGEPIPPVDISALEAQLDDLNTKRDIQAEETRRHMQEQIKAGAKLVAEGAVEIADLAVEIGTDIADKFMGTFNKLKAIIDDLFGKHGAVSEGIEETGEATETVFTEITEGDEEVTKRAIELTDERIKAINDEVDAKVLAYQFEHDVAAALYEEQTRIANEEAKKREAAEVEHQNALRQVRSGGFRYAQSLISSIGSLWNSYYETLLQNEELGDKERKKLMREQARSNKATAVFKAILDTASAVIGYLANPGGIPGIALSIMAGIAGAAQLAVIAATPIPAFAQGGSFVVPPGYENDSYLMRVQSGEQVDVTSAEQTKARREPPVFVHATINLAGETIADFITEAIRDKQIILDARI